MATYSEELLVELTSIMNRDRVPLFEAVVTYCEEKDLEVDEVVSWLDENVVNMIRQSALDTNRVRKCVEVKANALQFE